MQLHQNPIQRIAPLMVAVLGLSLLSTAAAEHGGDHFGGVRGTPDDVTNLQAEAREDGNLVTWDHVKDPENRDQFPNEEDAAEFRVYRQVGDEDFKLIATLDARTTEELLDTDVEEGVTYAYAVVYHDGVPSCDIGFEGECETVEVTAIPFFGAPLVGALAALGGVGAYAWIGRRRT